MCTMELPKSIPIISRAGIFLASGDGGDATRFAGLFKLAWTRIPWPARREIRRIWRSTDNRYAAARMLRGVPSPPARVQLSRVGSIELQPSDFLPFIGLSFGWDQINGKYVERLKKRRPSKRQDVGLVKAWPEDVVSWSQR